MTAGNSEQDFDVISAIRNSKLLDSIDQCSVPLVYHSSYNVGFCGIEKLHPFDAGKWGKIHDFLRDERIFDIKHIGAPAEATDSDLRIVHTEKYLNSLNWSANVAMIMEVPPVACLPNFVVQRKVRFNSSFLIFEEIALRFDF